MIKRVGKGSNYLVEVVEVVHAAALEREKSELG